jgi:sugar phosphate isomerase/epimerase
MTIKLSCGDHSFPKLPHGATLALISSLGFDAVDISAFSGSGHLSAETVISSPPQAAADIRRLTAETGLAVSDVFPTVITDFEPGRDVQSAALNHPDATVRKDARDAFLRFVEFANEVQSPGITMLPGAIFESESQQDSLSRAIDELAWRQSVASKAGLALSVEPHFGAVIGPPSDAAALVEAVPGLKLTLDMGHYLYQGYSQAEVQDLVPFARHFHVRQASSGVMQAISYEGGLDIEALVSSVITSGFSGYMAVEYVWLRKWSCDRVDNLSETVITRDRLRQALSVMASRA